jgi:4-hydroxy-4-methyl-2-oxoglutarate aldolase
MAVDGHLDRLAHATGLTAALASDALDRLGLRSQAMDPHIVPVRAGVMLAGRAVPMVVSATDEISEAPYATELQAIDRLSAGDVPVYSVEPGVRAALWGELFSCAALQRGAIGAVVDGYVRDSAQIEQLGFPVFARGCSPLDTLGRAEVTRFATEAVCGGVTVRPGDWIVADRDGVVVVPGDAISDVAELVRRKASDEHGARSDLLDGASLRAVWEKWGVL